MSDTNTFGAGSSNSKKRGAEGDHPAGQQKKRKESTPNTFPCTLPSDVWDELKAQMGGLVLSKAGTDMRANYSENSTVCCVVSLNNSKLVPCHFKIDKSTQCASIQILSTVKGKELCGFMVYGAHLVDSDEIVEWYDDKSDISQFPGAITKDYMKHRDLMLHLTLKMQSRPVTLGYHREVATSSKDTLQQLAENLFSSHLPAQLDLHCRFTPDDQHQGESIQRAFKDWNDALHLSSRWCLNWFYRKHTEYQPDLTAWAAAKDPQLVNSMVSFPPHLMTKGGAGNAGGRCGTYAVQDVYMDHSHYTDTMGMAVLRERAASSRTLTSVYRTARGTAEATVSPILAWNSVVNATVPVEGSFILKINLHMSHDVKGALPEAGQQLNIELSGHVSEAIRVTTLSLSEAGFDIICIATRLDPNLFKDERPVRIDLLETVLNTNSTNQQLEAIRAFSSYVKPADSPLDLECLLLNQTGCKNSFDMDHANLASAKAYWSTNAHPNLDSFQMQVVNEAASLRGAVLFVHGGPGTGKTQTLIATLDVSVRTGNTVLFCGPSPASVDEAVRKAVGSGRFNDTVMVRMTPSHVSRAQMAEEELEHAYLAQAMEIEAAERHPWVSQCRTMAAWKIRLRDQVADGTVPDPEVKGYVDDWIRAYQNLFQRGRLSRQARLPAEQAWDRADDRMSHYVLTQAKVVFVTLNTASHEDLVANFKPSLLVVDQAASATEPDVLVPLMAFQKTLKGVILGGDDKQVPPVVYSDKLSEFARILGYSPFTRWQSRNNFKTVRLQRSYRFEQVHCEFLSRTLYEGRLSSGLPDGIHSSHVAKFNEVIRLLYPKFNGELQPRVAIDVGDDSKAEIFGTSTSLQNQVEAHMVITFAKFLVEKNVAPAEILIITPYTGQATLISGKIARESALTGVRVRTVMQAQGSEAAFVLVSFVRDAVFSNPTKTAWVGDAARLCVALSRMKAVLVAFGTWNLHRKMTEKLLKNASTKTFGELVLDFATKSRIIPAPQMLKPQ